MFNAETWFWILLLVLVLPLIAAGGALLVRRAVGSDALACHNNVAGYIYGVIGVVYAVSAAGAVLLADRAPHGAEHVRAMLVGNILTVRGEEVLHVAALYGAVGVVHWLCRRPFLLISFDPERAYRNGLPVRAWDLLFYATFGVVVTSSVRIAGVLLVFSYLIVPALAGLALGTPLATRLGTGWAFGALVSVLGIVASAALDLPTGATVVCVFGAALLALWTLVPAARGLRSEYK